ncbi:hypothetical protein RCI24_22045 [Enterobacter hormaechei]|uniref:hypothetical protein n=1 Tax=Enterobacter hormaechei TaxID=158836 RepID=UPI002A748BF9|nr:hypothetical protein [Enterobacter hormaechei]MDY3568117.1 hypothetical protein [Enterobacter hormaechei]
MTDKALFSNDVLKDFHDRIKNDITLCAKDMVQGKADAEITADGSKIIDYLTQSMQANHIDAEIITAIASLKNDPEVVDKMSKLDQALTLSEPPAAPILNVTVDDKLKAAILPQVDNIIDWSNAINGSGTTLAAFTIPMPSNVVGTADSLFRYTRRHELKIIEAYDNMLNNSSHGPDPVETVIENILRGKKKGGFISDYEYNSNKASYDKIKTEIAAYNHGNAKPLHNTSRRMQNTRRSRDILDKLGQVSEQGMGLYKIGQGIIDLASVAKLPSENTWDLHNSNLRIAQGTLALVEGTNTVGTFIANKLVSKLPQTAGAAVSKYAAKYAPVIGGILSSAQGFASVAKNAVAAEMAGKTGNIGRQSMFGVMAALDAVGAVFDLAGAICHLIPGAGSIAGFIFSVGSTIVSLISDLIGFFTELVDTRSDDEKLTQAFQSYLDSAEFNNYLKEKADYYRTQGYDIYDMYVDANAIGITEGTFKARSAKFRHYHKRLKEERKETADYVERYAIEDMTNRAWTLTGRSGDDIIRVLTTKWFPGMKYLLGGGGNDILISALRGSSQLEGEKGDDTLVIRSSIGAKVLAYGGDGDDIITTVAQRYSIYNPATDELEKRYTNTEFFGGSGNDTIDYTPDAEIFGGPGKDILKIPDIDLYKTDLVSNETALFAGLGNDAIDLAFWPTQRSGGASMRRQRLLQFEGVHINNVRDYSVGVITSTDDHDKIVRLGVNGYSDLPESGYNAISDYYNRPHAGSIFTLFLENCNSTVYLQGKSINLREDFSLVIHGAGTKKSVNHIDYDQVIPPSLPELTKHLYYDAISNYYNSNHGSNTGKNTTFVFSPFSSQPTKDRIKIDFRDIDYTAPMWRGNGINFIYTENIANFVLLPPNTGEYYDFSHKSEVIPMITVKVVNCTVYAPQKGTTFRPLLDKTFGKGSAYLILKDLGTPCTLDLSGTETATLTYRSAEGKYINNIITDHGILHLEKISTFILNNGTSDFPPLECGVTVICPGGSHTVSGGPAENDFLSLEGRHTFIGGTGKNNFLIRSPKTFKAGTQWNTKVSAQNDQNTLIFYDVRSLDEFTVRETNEGLEFCITTDDRIVLPVFVDMKWHAATNLPNATNLPSNDLNALKQKLDNLEKRYLSILFPFAKKRNRISGKLFMEFVKNRLTNSATTIDSEIYYSYFKPSHLTTGINILKFDGVWGHDVDESQYLLDTIETPDQSASTNFILTAGLDSSPTSDNWSVPASYKTGKLRTDLISVNARSVLKMTVTLNNGQNTGANMVVIHNDDVPVNTLKGEILSDGSAIIRFALDGGLTIITFKNGLPDWLYFTREKRMLSGDRLSNFFRQSRPVRVIKKIYIVILVRQVSQARVARDLADVSGSPQLIPSSFDLHNTFPETGYSGAQFSLVPEGEGVKYDWAVSDDWLTVNDEGIITLNKKPLTTQDVTVTGTPKDATTDHLIEYTFSVYRWFEKVALSAAEMTSIATIQAAAGMQGKQIADTRLIVADAESNTLCAEWGSSLADSLLKATPGTQLVVQSAGKMLQLIRIDPDNNSEVQFTPYPGSQGDAEVLAVSNIETFRSIGFLEGIYDVTWDAPATAFKHSQFTLGTPDGPENYEWSSSDSRLEVNQKGRVFFTQALPSDATPVITARDKRNGLSLSYRVPSTAWFGIGSCVIAQASDTLGTGNASSMLYQYQPGGREFMFVPQKPALMGIGRLSVSTDAQLNTLSATDSLYRKRLEGIYLIESEESIAGTYLRGV